jgi:hypothetical protein
MNSIELVKKLNVSHYSILRLIVKYNPQFNSLGKITKNKALTNGRPGIYFDKLNVKHQYFLITLLKNTFDTVKFKLDIIKNIDS